MKELKDIPPGTTHTANGAEETEHLNFEPHVPPIAQRPISGLNGDYEVRGEIARGGMGRIVEAYDRRHHRTVALKLLLRRDETSAKRFEREAWITGRLQHPSIVPLYEAGRWPTGEAFFAMNWVRGISLAEAIQSKPGIAERMTLLPILSQ